MTLEKEIAKCQLDNTFQQEGETLGKTKVNYCTLEFCDCPYKGKTIYIKIKQQYFDFFECLKEEE